jgi:hypothetical protein
MSRVEKLLHAFTAEFRAAGDADPRPYLREVSGTDRAELTALIDHFLATEPPSAFDPDAFATFRADRERVALVSRLLDDRTLTQFRQSAGLSKIEISARLAVELELGGQENAVKAAYHEIETGQVEPERVRERIWTICARHFNATIEQLREATRVAFEARPARSGVVHARSEGKTPEPPRTGAAQAPGDAAVRRAFFFED